VYRRLRAQHTAGCVTRPCSLSRSRLTHRITSSPRRQRGAQRAPLRRSSAPTRVRICAKREPEVNRRRTLDAKPLPCVSESPLSAPQPLGPSPARSAQGRPVRPSTTRASTSLRASTARSKASTDGRSFSAPRGSIKTDGYNSGDQGRILRGELLQVFWNGKRVPGLVDPMGLAACCPGDPGCPPDCKVGDTCFTEDTVVPEPPALREFRTSGSVGALGEQSPGAT